MTTTSPQDTWGELRSLMHQSYPNFSRLWTCLMRFDGDERHAAARYVQRSLGMIAGGLTQELEVFDEDVLEAWIAHMVWGQLWQHEDLFALHPELMEQALADVALREHVQTGLISAEALFSRQTQIRTDGVYYALGSHREWVQGMMIAVLEPGTAACTEALHQHIAQWNAMPDAQRRLADEVRGGIGQARDTLLGSDSSRGVLPSLLGGGLGIGQLFGAGLNTIRQATDSLSRMGEAFSTSREEALSKLESQMVQFCLNWLSSDF